MTLYFSVALAMLGALLLRRRLQGAVSAAALAFLVLLVLLASSFWFISNLLTGRGIDESVVYHLRADLTGAAFADFLGPILLSVALVGLSGGVALLVYRTARARATPSQGLARPFIAVSSLMAACYLNPAVNDLQETYPEPVPVPASTTQSTPVSRAALAGIQFPARKKNLVVLYLESFERTYLDEKIFPHLAPHLEALEKQALSFTNIGGYYGDGWTIAGLVSSQCGIPLALPEGQENAISGSETFLPGATCLGDLLQGAGYRLEFMGGADLAFAGKGNFFRSHGFSRVFGLHELKERLVDSAYQHQWGLHDDTLLDMLKERYEQLASGNKPFGLFGLTVNTHHPEGIVADPCISVQYEKGNDPTLNAIHCADRLVGEFVAQLRSSSAWKDTMLVIASDHLALKNSARERLNEGARRNLLLVLGDGVEPRKVDTPAALIDAAPTLLGLLGAEGGASLGFGRDMLGSTPTLAASVKDLRAELRGYRSALNALWQFPQLSRGLRVDVDRARMSLDGTTTGVPALLLMKPNLHVQEIRYQPPAWQWWSTLTDAVAGLPPSQSFLWIDDCGEIRPLARRAKMWPEAPLCLAAGSLDARTITVVPLVDSAAFSLEQIQKMRDPEPARDVLVAARVDALRKASRYGLAPTGTLVLEPELEGTHLVISTAARGGHSLVDNLEAPLEVTAKRGLTLFGLNRDEGPVLLSHWDTCEHGVTEAARSGYRFQDDIQGLRTQFGAFMVIAHDSAICGKRDLAGLFAGSGFREWRDLAFRTPYVGVVTSSGRTHEFTGDIEESIAIELKGLLGKDQRKHSAMQRKSGHLPRVAHAGGAYEGKTYTNSLAALNLNRERYQLFEIDLSWTSDGHLVCLHDWKESWGNVEEKKASLNGFLKINPHRAGPTGCTLETLVGWMKSNPTARVVTDVKEDNVRALAKIARRYPELKARFIPQIYSPSEYRVVRELGFPDIIWTLYRMQVPEEKLLYHLKTMDLFALTMPLARAQAGLAKDAAKATGVLSYVHTLNTADDLEYARSLGANSIYTDTLTAETPSSP